MLPGTGGLFLTCLQPALQSWEGQGLGRPTEGSPSLQTSRHHKKTPGHDENWKCLFLLFLDIWRLRNPSAGLSGTPKLPRNAMLAAVKWEKTLPSPVPIQSWGSHHCLLLLPALYRDSYNASLGWLVATHHFGKDGCKLITITIFHI